MEIALSSSRKTRKNYFRRFYAREGQLAWYVFTRNSKVIRAIQRTYTDQENSTEKDIDPSELPVPILLYVRKSL